MTAMTYPPVYCEHGDCEDSEATHVIEAADVLCWYVCPEHLCEAIEAAMSSDRNPSHLPVSVQPA